MMTSNPERYGTVAVVIHWVSAALIVLLLISGFAAENAANVAIKAGLLRIHVPAGVTLLLLTAARIGWWWRLDNKPGLPAGLSPYQRLLAKSIHTLLYATVFLLAGSGIAMLIASGAGPVIFSPEGGPLPDFSSVSPRGPHGAGAITLLFLSAFHVAAALYHHFISRDLRLSRIWFSSAKP